MSRWQCQYCEAYNAPSDWKNSNQTLDLGVRYGNYTIYRLNVSSNLCSNPECGEITISVELEGVESEHGYVKNRRKLLSSQLRPESIAKPQPEYIPDVIKQDYYEACRIRDLSPKASATLARRCMQGMIRDFFGISEPTLFKEIDTLRKQASEGKSKEPVTPDVLEALDHLRGLGNIGAHMEKDINVIVDVEPEEAQLMIEMIEHLFEEWYVARYSRAQKFQRLRSIAGSKKELKAPDKLPLLPPPEE